MKNFVYAGVLLSVFVLTNCSSEAEQLTSSQNTNIVADAGSNRVVLVYNQVNLISSASDIPAGLSVGYQWSILNKPGSSTAKIINPQLSFAHFTPDQAGEYLLQLSINYNQQSYTDTIILTVLNQQGNGLGQLTGIVDSSLVDRWGGNKVYIFSGTVTPDDIDGMGVEPLQVVDVQQSNSQCRFNYQVLNLPDGQYTIAFTKQGAQDDPLLDDAISFSSVHNITVNNGNLLQQYDFPPKSLIQVGPNRTYTTLMQAYAVAKDGDVIEIDAGLYTDNIVVWRQNNLTIRGVGAQRPHLTLSKTIPYVAGGTDLENGKGIFVTKGNNIRIENLEFSQAAVQHENGAAVRIEGADLTICNAYIHDGENGVLGGGGHLLIEYTEFFNNGFGTGQTHNIYVDTGASFTFRHSYSHRAKIGHNLKSRAGNNYILYSRIMDETLGTASYQVDLPNGGSAYLVGNVIQQGRQNDNSTIISFGAEGLQYTDNDLHVAHNTIVNDHDRGSFFYLQSPGAGQTFAGSAINNIFIGPGIVGHMNNVNLTQANNFLDSNDTLVAFANRGAFDYHLSAGSQAIGQGTDPGSVNGFSLFPEYEYVLDARRQQRIINDVIEPGAFEF